MFTLKVSLVALALSSVGFAVPASGAQHSTSSEAKSGSAAAKSSNAPSHLPTDATAAKSTNPTASAVVSHKAGDHGDGFYTGTQHDNGTTTFQYHGKGKPVAPSPASAPALGRRLNPDEQVICSPGGNVPVSDLDAARSALSAQMGEGLSIGNHQRAFWVSGLAIAFACCYASGGCKPTGVQLNNDFGEISIHCGQSTSLGYVKDPHAGYGRTFANEPFC